MTNGLEFRTGCFCAGSGCGGHINADFAPIGWQGAAQHTYTQACNGLHAPGPCPEREPLVTLTF